MVRICKLEKLRGNEILAKDIINDNSCITLMNAGDRLHKNQIERLKEFGITEVCIQDERNINANNLLKEEIQISLQRQMQHIIERNTFGNDGALKEIKEIADSIIIEISDIKEITEQVFDLKEHSLSLYEHSICVCSMSILIAIKINLSRKQVYDIAVGSLLHDIGIQYLNYDYYKKKISEYSEYEKKDYENHPIYGYSLLSDQKWLSDFSKKIILYHHETRDGKGFPIHTKDIPMEVEIVSICDMYDEIISGIGYQKMKTYQVIEYLKTNLNSKYNQNILKTLIDFIAVFPVGTIVKTSSNETAMILKQNKNFPDRPIIQIVKNNMGDVPEKHTIIDLLEEKTIFIEEI